MWSGLIQFKSEGGRNLNTCNCDATFNNSAIKPSDIDGLARKLEKKNFRWLYSLQVNLSDGFRFNNNFHFLLQFPQLMMRMNRVALSIATQLYIIEPMSTEISTKYHEEVDGYAKSGMNLRKGSYLRFTSRDSNSTATPTIYDSLLMSAVPVVLFPVCLIISIVQKEKYKKRKRIIS